MREIDIQQQIRLALGRIPGLVLWRNNTGVADHKGAKVRYGLAVGSSDLIGIYSQVIGPEHVGSTFGRFLAGEVKAPGGTVSDDQSRFLSLVSTRGGLAGVWRSTADALATLGIIR
jgi:hypothetical protein